MRKVFLDIAGILSMLMVLMLFSTPTFAASSSSYQLSSQIDSTARSSSASYHNCAGLTDVVSIGSSASYALTPVGGCSVAAITPTPVCGNAVIESGEACDDGNVANGDGCSSVCQIQAIPGGGGGGGGFYIPPITVPTHPPVVPPLTPPVTIPPSTIVFTPPASTPAPTPTATSQPTHALVHIAAPVPAPQAILPTTPYRTNDLKAFFFEKFPGGSGDYGISISSDKGSVPLDVIKAQPGYFSVHIKQEVPDGLYTIHVQDKNDPQKAETITLRVKQKEGIPQPQLISLDQLAIGEQSIDQTFYSTVDQPLLTGKVSKSGEVAIFSELLQKTFVVQTDDQNTFVFKYPEKLVAGVSDTLTIVARYPDNTLSREQTLKVEFVQPRMAAPLPEAGFSCPVHSVLCALIATLLFLFVTIFMGYFYLFPSLLNSTLMFRTTWLQGHPGRMIRWVFSLILIAALITLMIIRAFAATTTPQIVNYQGVLKNAGGTPITTAQTFRFSLWSDADYDTPADFDGAGAIPPAAPGYSGYQEVQTVTPDANGFFQVQVGSVTALPSFNISSHLFLQVEVKPSASANTAFEELDIDGVANTNDRQPIGSLPYANNADFIDNKEIGTGAGNIATLGVGGLFSTSVIPGGTNQNNFTLDSDDTGGDVTLQFGTTLNESLKWNNAGSKFVLSDDLDVGGNLAVSGTSTTSGLTSTGSVNFSGSTGFRIREDSNPNVSAACASIGELIFDTTSNELMRCTATGIAGVATWTNVDTTGGTSDFEAVYTNDADKVLTTSNGNVTLNSGTGDTIIDSNDWNVDATGALDAASITANGALTATGTTNLNGTANFNGITNVGDGGDAVAVNSSSWGVSSAGVASGFTGITSTGAINFSGGSSFKTPQGATDPATCAVGQIFFNTTSNTLKLCSATDTWTIVGGPNGADLLDALDSTQFLRSDTSDNFTSGTLTTDAGTTLAVNGGLNASSATQIRLRESANPTTSAACTTVKELIVNTTANRIEICTATGIAGSATWLALPAGDASTLSGLSATQFLRSDTSSALTSGTLTANSGTTLQVDGTLNTTGVTSIGNNSNTVAINSSSWDISSAGVASGFTGISSTGAVSFTGASSFFVPQGASDPGTCSVGQQFYNTTANALKVCTSSNVWTIAVSGNGADLLDGVDSTQFLRSDASDNFTSGTLTTDNGTTLTVNGVANIGDNGDTVTVNSNTWDVSGAGVASGFTGLSSSGTVSSTGTLSATGVVNASGSTQFRIREDSDPNTNSACSSIGELIFNTTSNQLMRCTATGAPGAWTNVDTTGGTSDFEAIYTNDADKILTTSNGNFTVDAGSGTVAVKGVTNINDSNNRATNIGTGTTTSAVTIGGTGAQTIDVGDGAGAKTVGLGSSNTTSTTTLLSGSGGLKLNVSNNQVTNINTGTSTGQVSLGGNSNCVQVDSNTWDISCAGAATGFTGVTSTGTIDFTGATSFRVPQGASDPATCSVGQEFYNTTSNALKVCTSTNTWTIAASANGADLLDGVDSTQFLRSDTSDNFTSGTLTTDVGTTLQVNGSLTATNGATVSGATVNINASSNNTTNIGTGTTTSTVTIGGTGAQTIDLGDGAGAKTVGLGSSNTTSTTTLLSGSGGLKLNVNNNQVTNINTGTSTGTVTIGGNSNSVAIDSSTWDITAAGVASGITGITSTGTVNFSGTSSQRLREVSGVAANAACTTVKEIVLDTSNNHIYVCTVTGVAGSATWVAAAFKSEDLTFYPEYNDAVIYQDGSANNGTLSSDYDAANSVLEQFYDWTSKKAALNDDEVRFRFALPADFASTGALSFRYRTGTTSSADNKLDISINNATDLTSNQPTACASSTGNVSGTANTFATASISAATINAGCTGSTALNAGDIVEIDVKFYAKNTSSAAADAGYVQLQYNN